MQKDIESHPATDRASGQSWTPEKAAQRLRGTRRDGAKSDLESQMATVGMPPNVGTHGEVTLVMKALSVGASQEIVYSHEEE